MPGREAQVCLYFKSFDVTPAQPFCLAPATEAPALPDNVQGCCGTDEVKVDYEGFNADLYFLVRPESAGDACFAYQLFYRY
ncbi:MAG: hypothetical protein MUF34_08895 [Polyangiaceae bacterium]|nr:hypothetical protein [Polyangiaceae bacterium]